MRLTENTFNTELVKIATNKAPSLVINYGFDMLELSHIQKLIQALKTNNTSHTLDLKVNFIKGDSFKALGEYFSKYHTLEKFELANNDAGTEAISHLLVGLHDNKGLRILDLKANNLDDSFIPLLAELLEKNKTLELVNLSFNNFSDEGIKELEKLTTGKCMVQVKDKSDLKIKKKHMAMFKRRIKSLFKLRDSIKSALYMRNKSSNFISESIINAVYYLDTMHPGTISFYDALQLIKQILQSHFPNSSHYSLHDFICFCMTDEFVVGNLIRDVLTAPHTETRNASLDILGSAYLATNPEAGIYSIHCLLVSHICLSNISNKSDSQKRLSFEAYRALVSDLGLVAEPDLDKWKKEFENSHTNRSMGNVLKKIDAIINSTTDSIHRSEPNTCTPEEYNTLTMLYSHRAKRRCLSQVEDLDKPSSKRHLLTPTPG